MLYKRKRMKNEMIYPKYTLDYIRKCDNEEMKEKGKGVGVKVYTYLGDKTWNIK